MSYKKHIHPFYPHQLKFLIYLYIALFHAPELASAQINAKYSSDTAEINKLIKTAHKILNPDSAIIAFDSVLRLSIKANYPDGAFAALITTAIKYYEKEDFARERSFSILALQWAPKVKRKDAVGWCYNNIGDAYFSEGDYIHASDNLYTALTELKKAGEDTSQIAANIYDGLGLVNFRLNQVDKALFYLNGAENVCRKHHHYYQLANTYSIKGEYYLAAHKPDSAITNYNRAMEIGKKNGKIDLQVGAYTSLGKAFIDAGKYEKAISSLQTAISLAENKYPYLVVEASYSLGDAWFHMHKYKEAEAILLSMLKDIKAHNLEDQYIDFYAKLRDIYKATGQYKRAVDFGDTIAVLKDSLFSNEKTKAINLMEVKYKTAEKDKEIAQNQLLIAEQKNKLTQKNLWIIYIVTGVFLLTLLIMFMYRNSRHKERLQEEKIKTLEKENTINILKGVVEGEEKERSRLARELHDGIGGILSAAMMRFMALRHKNETITKTPAYSEGMQLLDEMGDEIRKTAHNLMPDVLLKQSLPEALQSYCNSVMDGSGLQIDCQCYGTFDNLTQGFKLNVYRMAQELLKNITGHARASRALVQLVMHDHFLAITVEDNGTGFDQNTTKDGIGLHNLQTRVSSMSGTFTLESELDKGTTVSIELPIVVGETKAA
jgi:signal transduction histidine kinase